MLNTTERRYLNVSQLAAYIDSTEGSVRQLVHQHRVPHLKRGRRVLFDRLAIDAWLADHRVEPRGSGNQGDVAL